MEKTSDFDPEWGVFAHTKTNKILYL